MNVWNNAKSGIGKGDVVVTHRSSRLMYVYDVIEQWGAPAYQCVWFEGGRLAESVFEAGALRLARDVEILVA